MASNVALVLSAILAVAWSAEDLRFPPGFKFGVATSSYQVEGAWNVSDKGESIWDNFTHRKPSPIFTGENGDVACNSYHLWREDIRLMEELGVHFYRMSISWPRLLPSGFSDVISEDGKRYYNNLIDGLREKNIEPVITLYHWDLPQRLQNLGGWTNPLIADWFGDYARVVYSLYGDRVKTWLTINEPYTVCDIAYFMGIFAPGIADEVGAYLCTKNVVMAHAKAWRIYDEEFKSSQRGQVSIVASPIWMEPANESEEATAALVREYQGGRFTHPIYSNEGGWPPAIEEVVAEVSQKRGYRWSMLPKFTLQEIEFIKGTYDFFAMNFYGIQRVRRAKEGEQLKPWPSDAPILNAKLDFHPDWPMIMQAFAFYPEGMRKQLRWVKQHYGDIPVLITENGRETTAGLDDQHRVHYYREFLKQVLFAIKDGVNVTGYAAWTLMDNFEWIFGNAAKYGLYEVDFKSENRTRTARESARYFARVVRSRSLNVPPYSAR